MKTELNSIGIIGLGLIGGSFAKAFASLNIKVFGFDKNSQTVYNVAKSNIFDAVTDNLTELVKLKPDLIYICTPISAAKKILIELSKNKVKTPITDACSTKYSLVKMAKPLGLNFCGGHPIAGREKSGFDHSSAEMLKSAFHFLTPDHHTPSKLTELLKNLHEQIGMKVEIIDAKSHDKLFGLISHFPHLISFALIDLVDDVDNKAFEYTGGGFRDFTRIAASDPKMWTDIFIDNKSELIPLIDKYIEILQSWKSNIIENNSENIFRDISVISNIRKNL